jgi:hypothetical protein
VACQEIYAYELIKFSPLTTISLVCPDFYGKLSRLDGNHNILVGLNLIELEKLLLPPFLKR